MGGQSDAGEGSCDEVNTESGVLHITSGPYKCEYVGCNASFKKPSRLKQHICSHTGERPFKCDESNCDKAYTHACHLKRHKAKSHVPQLYKKMFKCPHPGCGLQASDEYNLKRHFRRKHEKVFSCTECGKIFLKNHHLRTHMYSHKGESPFRCEECEVMFASARTLKRHLRTHKTHSCKIQGCEEVFTRWTDLLKHVKVTHPLEFICDVCGQKYKVKSNLRQHVITHLKDRPTYPCTYPECLRIYSRSTYLKNHIKWKHEGSGGHKCTFDGCVRIISTKAKLLKHLAWHQRGKKPSTKKAEGSKRKSRCDKGIPRRSMAAVLSGLPPLPLPIEKKIIHGLPLESDEDIPLLVMNELDKACSDEPGEQNTSSEAMAIPVKVVDSC